MPSPVTKSIEVPCTPAEAFRIFVADIGAWWPLQSHSISAGQGGTAQGVSFEPRTGGALTEIGPDGAAHLWGRILVYTPGEALGFTWFVGRSEDEATRVNVTFTATEGGTKVTLVHSGWEVLGEAADAQRDGYDSGWVPVLDGYRTRCASPDAAAEAAG
ncbi:MAG: SRPBCC domain-containing protein [Pseudomonadota bacterium]